MPVVTVSAERAGESADPLSLKIHGAPRELQYGNVLRFEVEVYNDSNRTVDLEFACFGGASYVVKMRAGTGYEEVYRSPLCWSVVERTSVPAYGSLRWAASWPQVVWNPGDPDDPANPQGPEIHASLGDYRIEVEVAPYNRPVQLRAAFEFRLIDSEWSRPEVAYPVASALAAGAVTLAVLQFWRSRNPAGPANAVGDILDSAKRSAKWASSATKAGLGRLRRKESE